MALVITVLDLEREPIEFSETIPAGAIDYGSGIRQIDGMPVNGRADLLTEHRGPHNLIQDIRLRAGYQGKFRNALRPLPGSGGSEARRTL